MELEQVAIRCATTGSAVHFRTGTCHLFHSAEHSAVAGSVDDGLRPKGDVIGVALEELAIGHAE